MAETFDYIVLGLGGFGTSALYHLAARGASVLGIERFEIAHDRGSSHGETRIIRKAYIEHPDYVPLVLRAYELWAALADEAGRKLYELPGLILAGPPEGEAISGTRLAARLHDLAIEEVEPSVAEQRFHGFRFPEGFAVMFDVDAGFLFVEECQRAHAECAVARGATIHTEETVLQWISDGRRVHVQTDRARYEAAGLIVTAGAWTAEILADLAIPLTVLRKLLFWHDVQSGDYNHSAGAPAYYFELPAGHFYGFPSLDGQTVKVAEHTGGRTVAHPSDLDRECHSQDVQPVSQFLQQALPEVVPQPTRHSTCMYTLTPDHHFIVDRHPRFGNIVVGAGFSGHGFKFTSVIGEALANLALAGKTDHPIGFLSIDREALR